MNFKETQDLFNATQVFLNLSEEGIIWENIKRKFVLTKHIGDLQKVASEEMKNYVAQRDLLDFVIYRAAVLEIFPEHSFEVIPIVNEDLIEEKDESHKFQSQYYRFEIFSKNQKIAKCFIHI